ncbi:hypothetical protein ABZY03_29245 [Streptomyces klenkii]|uniref:hypothetical protein n=1 Tax=Streptomyces klenkii TaxID=1420899 RepID=UPI0033A3AC3B
MRPSQLSAGLRLATVLVVAAGTWIAGPPASATVAGPVPVAYRCQGLGMDLMVAAQVTVETPATVQRGTRVTAQMSLAMAANAPFGVPARAVSGTADLTLAGAWGGTIPVSGLTNPDSISAGEPVRLSGGTATVALQTPGTATFTPGDLHFTALGITASCTVSGSAPVAATTIVTP